MTDDEPKHNLDVDAEILDWTEFDDSIDSLLDQMDTDGPSDEDRDWFINELDGVLTEAVNERGMHPTSALAGLMAYADAAENVMVLPSITDILGGLEDMDEDAPVNVVEVNADEMPDELKALLEALAGGPKPDDDDARRGFQ